MKLGKLKKYMSAVKKDCARSLDNPFVVLSHLECSRWDIFFTFINLSIYLSIYLFIEFMLLIGKIRKDWEQKLFKTASNWTLKTRRTHSFLYFTSELNFQHCMLFFSCAFPHNMSNKSNCHKGMGKTSLI